MNIADYIVAISSLTALILGLIANYFVWIKTPHETRTLDANAEKLKADADNADAAAASTFQKLAIDTAKEVAELKQIVKTQEKEIAKWRKENEELKRMNDALRDWSTRLVLQLKANRIEPVEFPFPKTE